MQSILVLKSIFHGIKLLGIKLFKKSLSMNNFQHDMYLCWMRQNARTQVHNSMIYVVDEWHVMTCGSEYGKNYRR